MRFNAIFLSALTIGSIALPAYAQTQLNLPCLQAAVEKRENSYISAFESYTTTVRAALTIRRDSLKAAAGISDRKERNTVAKNAEKSYKTTLKSAGDSRKAIERQAKSTYKTEAKVCGA